ncbi:adenosylcobinamide-GDP ribazoletransferase [Shigella sonnei]|nr:adenosylcobinamide-GDP ribazoletransferase [Shigella sonnei]
MSKLFWAMLSFITRLPVPRRWSQGLDFEHYSRGIITFPLIGLLLGAISGLVFMVLQAWCGVPLAALFSVLVLALMTGGFHLDGLADTCDGVFSARSRDRMLEIMRDSRLGTHGGLALIFVVLAKILVLSELALRGEPILARGSGNIASAPAMSRHLAEKLLLDVICYTRELAKNGVTLFGVGDLGMANTTPAAAIVSTITGRAPEEVVGIGANLPTDKLANKIDVVRRAITLNQPNPQDGVDVLAKVGGFDLVGMAGVMLGAASCGLPVLLDGFLSYAAALAACQMSPAIKPYLIPSHLSAEKGARIALSHLGLEPYLNMEMRLGEGSGAALAMPIIEAACAIYNNMGELAASNIVLPGNTTSDLNS